MESNGNLIRVFATILFLATPAMAIRIFSNYYDATYLQPLALTKENMATAREGESFVSIDVNVGWGRNWSGTMTQSRLRDVIATTLKSQTDFYQFEFYDQPGKQIDVTFIVGPNSYGPFPPGRMIAGIKSALIALRMTNGPER